jgi:ArsR family transcriptional regulator
VTEERNSEEAPLSAVSYAAMFKALGEPTRLRIFHFLRACCRPVAVDDDSGDVRPVNGPTVGEVCCHVTGNERVTSTISEHLKELRTAGLILTERRGKHFICAVNPAAVVALAEFFGEAPEVQDGDGRSCVEGCGDCC